MPKVKITNKFLSNIIPPKDTARINYFDTELTGFLLEVRKNSSMTFYYSYTQNGKKVQKKLGSPNTISIDDTRRLILKIKKAIATDSLESLFVKKSTAPTLLEFYEEHYLPYVQLHSKSWKHNRSHFTHQILPKLGDKRMNEITAPEISSMQMELVQLRKLQNSTANKAVIFLRHAYNLAKTLKINSIVDYNAPKNQDNFPKDLISSR